VWAYSYNIPLVNEIICRSRVKKKCGRITLKCWCGIYFLLFLIYIYLKLTCDSSIALHFIKGTNINNMFTRRYIPSITDYFDEYIRIKVAIPDALISVLVVVLRLRVYFILIVCCIGERKLSNSRYVYTQTLQSSKQERSWPFVYRVYLWKVMKYKSDYQLKYAAMDETCGRGYYLS